MKKHFVILFGILIAIVFACSNDENPDPTCDDGVMNGDETGIDCGGDCDACFVCTTTYCALLSGATTDEAQTQNVWVAVGVNWKLTFKSTGKFSEEYQGGMVNGIWEFNNPDSPSKLKCTYKPGDVNQEIFNYNLIKLVSDTLIIEDETINTFIKQ